MRNVEKAKVVIAYNSCHYVVIHRLGFIHELHRQGYDVVVLAPWDNYTCKLANIGVEHLHVPMNNGKNPIADFFLFLNLTRALRQIRPVAAFVFTSKPNIYGSLAARVTGISIVNTIAGLGGAFGSANWLRWLLTRLYRYALASSQCVFFENSEDLQYFAKAGMVNLSLAKRVPGSGIDLVRFAPTPLPTNRETTVFLLMARMLREKGVAEFVEAAKTVRAQGHRAQFQLLGAIDLSNPSGFLRDELDQLTQSGDVVYLGYSDDVRKQIAEADCVVLPSYYGEGVPRSLLEAAAMGRPIITTDWVGCKDVVDDGGNGLLCRPRDASDLARRIVDFLGTSDEERAKMGQRGRRKMEAHFDERIVIKSYMNELVLRSAAGAM